MKLKVPGIQLSADGAIKGWVAIEIMKLNEHERIESEGDQDFPEE